MYTHTVHFDLSDYYCAGMRHVDPDVIVIAVSVPVRANNWYPNPPIRPQNAAQ